MTKLPATIKPTEYVRGIWQILSHHHHHHHATGRQCVVRKKRGSIHNCYLLCSLGGDEKIMTECVRGVLVDAKEEEWITGFLVAVLLRPNAIVNEIRLLYVRNRVILESERASKRGRAKESLRCLSLYHFWWELTTTKTGFGRACVTVKNLGVRRNNEWIQTQSFFHKTRSF